MPTIQEGMAEPEMDRLLQGAAVERVGEALVTAVGSGSVVRGMSLPAEAKQSNFMKIS